MNVDAQRIVEILSSKNAELITQNAILQAQVEQLMAEKEESDVERKNKND